MFDEMSVKQFLQFNQKQDIIEGYPDLGALSGSPEVATHAAIHCAWPVKYSRWKCLLDTFLLLTVNMGRIKVIITFGIKILTIKPTTTCNGHPLPFFLGYILVSIRNWFLYYYFYCWIFLMLVLMETSTFVNRVASHTWFPLVNTMWMVPDLLVLRVGRLQSVRKNVNLPIKGTISKINITVSCRKLFYIFLWSQISSIFYNHYSFSILYYMWESKITLRVLIENAAQSTFIVNSIRFCTKNCQEVAVMVLVIWGGWGGGWLVKRAWGYPLVINKHLL